jgi:hypothetical protein
LRILSDVESLLAAVLPTASERKLRLFACACARCFWDEFDHPRSRQAIEITERYADGLIGPNEYRIAAEAARSVARSVRVIWPHEQWEIRSRASEVRSLARDASQRNVRLSVRNAVRTALRLSHSDQRRAADGAKPRWSLESLQEELCNRFRDVFGPSEPLDSAVLAWNDRAVPHVAQAIYDERDFARLPILADALEDAGCTDDAILAHCRGGELHVRGCWVVDLILGKQ